MEVDFVTDCLKNGIQLIQNLQSAVGIRLRMSGEETGAVTPGEREGKTNSLSEKVKNKLKVSGEGKIRRHLPVGSGPCTVGCVDFMDDHTEDGVLFRLFYPTRQADIYERDRQWPLWLPRKQYGQGYAYFLDKNIKTYGKFFNWYVGDVYVPALWQAPVLRPQGDKFPVVVLSHGLGGNRTTYSTLCCELASHGMVVAALEHSDGSASMALRLRGSSKHQTRLHLSAFKEEWKPFEKVKDIFNFNYRNKQVHHRAEECRKVLDVLSTMNEGEVIHNIYGAFFSTSQLKNCLDLSKASVIGHSFGGATSLCALSKDKRFRLGVVLDGWMHPLDEQVYSNVHQPVFMLNYETFQWEKNVEQMSRFLNETNQRKMVTVRGTCHQSITDFQFIANPVLGRILTVRHTLHPKQAFGVSAKATLGFLRKHLGLAGDHHDDIIDGRHEHVILGSKVKRQFP